MLRLARVSMALFALIIATGLANAQTPVERRVALVIGNSAYEKVAKLPNPNRDASAVEAMLIAAGFETVRRVNDLSAVAMRRALRNFSDQVRDADVAVVFYAGHGIEVNGTNHLIPIDATLERDIDVEDEAIPLERVNQMLEPARRLRLIILDACRDNPFVRSMKRTLASRSIGRGLATVEVESSNTLIAFAAKAGSTAADGDGNNSPYTSALIKHLTTPGLDVRLALGRVRDEVLKSTRNRQEPFLYGSLGGSEIALVSASQALATPSTSNPEAAQSRNSNARPSEAAEAWGTVKETTSVPVLDAFIRRFNNTIYADLAGARATELRQIEAVKQAAAKKLADEEVQAKADARAREAREAEEKRKSAELDLARKNLLDRAQQYRVEALGISVVHVSSGVTGLMIASIDNGSDAQTKGLRSREVIVEAQGRAITTIADLEASLRAAKDAGRKAALLRLFSDDTGFRFLTVTMTGPGSLSPGSVSSPAGALHACAELDEGNCKANRECAWYRKTTTKSGLEREAHCQKRPQAPAKISN